MRRSSQIWPQSLKSREESKEEKKRLSLSAENADEDDEEENEEDDEDELVIHPGRVEETDFEKEEFSLQKREAERLTRLRAEIPLLPPDLFRVLEAKELGQGTYGKVIKVFHNGRRETMVAKQIIASSAAQVEKILREARLLQHLEIVCQPFLLCHGEIYRSEPNVYWILSELLGDFDTLAERMRVPTTPTALFPDQQRLRVSDMIMMAVSQVHKWRVAHRDIKPENIMVSQKGDQIKLIDFGEACGSPAPPTPTWSVSAVAAPTPPKPARPILFGATSTKRDNLIEPRKEVARPLQETCDVAVAVGSVLFMAPEVIAFGPDSLILHHQVVARQGKNKSTDLAFWQKADIWSLGMTLLSFLLGPALFDSLVLGITDADSKELQTQSRLLTWCRSGMPPDTWLAIISAPSLSSSIKVYLADFVRPMLAHDPSSRVISLSRRATVTGY